MLENPALRWPLLVLLSLSLGSSDSAHAKEQPSHRAKDEASIRSQIKLWDGSLIDKSLSLLDNVLAQDFLGDGAPREIYLKALESPGWSLSESSREDLRFRFYGNTAVVLGRWTQRGTSSVGGQFTSTFTFTDVWVKDGRVWKCAVSSSNNIRQAFSAFRPVRFGPDVRVDVVILFKQGITPDQIDEFHDTVLQPPASSDRHAPVASALAEYLRLPKLHGFEAVSLQLRSDLKPIERKFFIEEILRSPIVHRVFEDVVPSTISLD